MAERRNPYRYEPEYYVHGSAARKFDVTAPVRKPKNPAETLESGYERAVERQKRAAMAVPERQREYDRPVRKAQPQPQQEQKKLFSMSRSIGFFGILLLCGAMFCMGVLCIKYLELRAESTRLDKTIAALRSDLTVLLDTNAGKEEALTQNVDLDAIYQTAVGEFGMVFPNQNEVIYYDSADLSYVRQFADIPDTVTSILDKLVP